MQILIETLYGENGELYATRDGRRILLAKCSPELRIYEHSQRVNILGKPGYGVKTYNSVLTLLPTPETTCAVDVDFLRGISQFEMVCDIQRTDGIFERMKFGNLDPEEIALYGDWTFNISGTPDMIQRLLTL